MDIQLDRPEHDLTLEGDDLVLVAGAACTAQILVVRWLTIAGEWFLEGDDFGLWQIPGDFRDKQTTAKLAELRARMERSALECPGVTGCTITTFSLDRATRHLASQARATVDTGDAIDVVVDEAVA